jgi:hypothetical protein
MHIEYSHKNHSKNAHKRARVHNSITKKIIISGRVKKQLITSEQVIISFDDDKDIKQIWYIICDEINIQPINAEKPVIRITKVNRYEDIAGLIVELFDETRPHFFDVTSSIVSKAAITYKEVSQWIFQRRYHNMIVDPIFQHKDTRVDEKKAFLIMPFTESWSWAVEQSIRNIINTRNIEVVRADDMSGHNIMEDIWKGILSSRYIICDTTGRNPNVYYELGICHTLGKKVLLITQNVNDIPFNVRHLRHIVYDNTLEGFKSLSIGIEKFLY